MKSTLLTALLFCLCSREPLYAQTANVAPEIATHPVWMPLSPQDKNANCFTGHTHVSFRPLAGCRGLAVRKGSAYEVRYNQQGLRDRDYSPKPARGWIRVLYVGPSLIAAPGIAEEDAPPKVLEKALRDRFPKLEVINAGTEGYSTFENSRRLPEWMAAYQPTHVIVQWEPGPGSVADYIATQLASVASDGRTAFFNYRPNVSWLNSGWGRKWLGDSRLGHSVRTLLFGSYWAKQSRACAAVAEEKRAECLNKDSLNYLGEMKSTAVQSGAEFLVLYTAAARENNYILPPRHEASLIKPFTLLTAVQRYHTGPLGQALRHRNIDFQIQKELDPKKSLWWLPGDYHLSREGSREFVRQMEPTIDRWIGGAPRRAKR